MADPLVVLSDATNQISQRVVTINYDETPYHVLCRYGLWEGWQTVYTQTVTLAYEHTVEEYVGWQVNGVTVIDPGYSPGTPWGTPLPGFPTVTYACPVDGYFHEISFTSSAYDPIETFLVQVLTRTSEVQQAPSLGPTMWVSLSGQYIDWPWFLLAEQEACIQELLKILNEHRPPAGPFFPVNPGDPAEWAAAFTPEEAVQLKAGVDALRRMDSKRQPELAEQIALHVHEIVQVRTRDANGLHGMDAATKRA